MEDRFLGPVVKRTEARCYNTDVSTSGLCTACGRHTDAVSSERDGHTPEVSGSLGYVAHYRDGSTRTISSDGSFVWPSDRDDCTILVSAEVRPGLPDLSAAGWFAESDRAAEYAAILTASGEYRAGGVWITEEPGVSHRVDL
ncbi:hypothetical protein [Nocardia noduli]|uniref:hypothetical protein n=1 Tax=Nocardia noduli TaxID=2815722 RepID=UPI001C247DD2|nr:hypothetical protein [Nocardia noduli]